MLKSRSELIRRPASLIPLPILVGVFPDRAITEASAVAEVAEGFEQTVNHFLACAPCGIEFRRCRRHNPQALDQPPNEADGAADLVVVVRRPSPLSGVELVVDRVDARLVRVRQAHGGERVLVHVAQRVLAEDAADAVVAGAGGRLPPGREGKIRRG